MAGYFALGKIPLPYVPIVSGVAGIGATIIYSVGLEKPVTQFINDKYDSVHKYFKEENKQ